MTTLIAVVLVLVIVGVLLWLVNYIPWIDATIKQVIHVVVIVVTVLWLLGLLLGYSTVPQFRLPR